ncbi:MAG: hypothetical protein KA015_02715 [Spirochaetes bacterium]|nr:hypothetical protein [Spirochaetota bacterium]
MDSTPLLLKLLKNSEFLSELIVPGRKISRKKIGNVLLYIGSSRPRGRIDYGLRLIEELENSGNRVAGLIIEPDDPLNINPQIQAMKRFFLPAELSARQSIIKKNFNDPEALKNIQLFLNDVSSIKYDTGVVFYGNWVPPQLFKIPTNGFINFHPGPLPFLKGMEPDTFAVLEGWKKIWGTVHKVDEHFDTGLIITTTKKVKIKNYSTPVSILHSLTIAGIKAVSKACFLIHHPGRKCIFLKNNSGSSATIEKAFDESFIKWDSDSNEMLDRRLRAFCGQDIGIRLKASVLSDTYFIYNLETFYGKFEGIPGEVIGFYLKNGKYLYQPIIKTAEGAAVILLGEKVNINQLKRPENKYYPEWQIPPRKSKRSADLKTLRYSIRKYNDVIRKQISL